MRLRSQLLLCFTLGAWISGCGETLPVPPATSGTSEPTSASTLSAAPTAAGTPEDVPCDPSKKDVRLFTFPETPAADRPLRIVAIAEGDVSAGAKLTVREDRDGATVLASAPRRGGPPHFWNAEIQAPPAGSLRASVGGACATIAVAERSSPTPKTFSPFVWTPTAAWSRATEDLFSAWIEVLFDDPLDATPSWPALHDVLRDPKRNFLHDHLGYGEDNDGKRAISIDPDCADLPYFLRAYFAFKIRLPFAYSGCTRGTSTSPPRCVKWRSQRDARAEPPNDPPRAFGNFLRVTIADAVHSGNGRLPGSADEGDYYPVSISAATLRPGTIYADPYGHVLMVVRRIPQTADRGGMLFAVDGQPDGTVARRRFWRGNFLFALDPALGGPGFKRFRPVTWGPTTKPRAFTNAEIAGSADYGDYGLDQYESGVDGFYDRIEDALSPSPLDPERALLETIDALEEQVKGRVRSVANVAEHWKKNGGRIDMPDGAEIFETTGPWEDFSTPSRDLRLLIAIDIVMGFPDRVARRPQRYAMPKDATPEAMKAKLAARLTTELEQRKVDYDRSDGSKFSLRLADVVARTKELEMAYNPNDCPEVRWGAPAKSDEAATCKRRAGGDQRAKMNKVRVWFAERRRPPRGA